MFLASLGVLYLLLAVYFALLFDFRRRVMIILTKIGNYTLFLTKNGKFDLLG